ncbi:MAG TPA: hypothetical protein VIM69_00215 [Opitutaceae bacterium]
MSSTPGREKLLREPQFRAGKIGCEIGAREKKAISAGLTGTRLRLYVKEPEKNVQKLMARKLPILLAFYL